MNNPNHPLYNALGGNSNIHLLDNMLFSTDQHKPSLIPQYAAYPMETLAAHQHAMNLAVSGQSHVAAAVAAVNNAATTIDTSLLYQQNDHHQQQPISYKIPQVSSVLIQQHHHQQQLQQQQQQQQHQHQQAIVSTINSLQEKKKDIVAQAMREEKIFEEIRAAEAGHPKKTITSSLASNHSSSSSISTPEPRHQQQQQQQQQAVAIKSEPAVLPSTSSGHSSTPKMDDPKPGPSSAGSSGSMTQRSSIPNRGRGGGAVGVGGSSSSGGAAARPAIQRQQQIMPRLQLLEDEDDGLTCRMCLQPFWYKSELHDHLKSTHSITDPDRYEKEEREKKIRRIREEQQRIAIAKQQRLGAAAAAAVTKGFPSRPAAMPAANRGKGVTIGMSSRGGAVMRGGAGAPLSRTQVPAANRPGHAGPRPSFQYRDGAFICDLCKKSFSDGNDMVAHWKSHVKQQQQGKQSGGGGGGYPAEKPARPAPVESNKKQGRGRPVSKPAAQSKSVKTHTTSRGRPITSKQAGKKARQAAKKVKKGRSDKGKPKWTAYLVWSSRRRKEIKVEYPNYGFVEVGKLISGEWKEVTPDEMEKYKEEAERLNATNARKLPQITDSGEEDWSENDDPSFNQASKKPIMLKIKKEARPNSETRSGRKRKRPSFFQEFENEESNLDKILDDFEQEQLHEARTPKPRKAVKNPGSRPRQRRAVVEEEYDDYDDEVELETTRSGRVRKKTKMFNYPDDDGDQESENDEERDEYHPDSEIEEPDEDYDDAVVERLPPPASSRKTSRKKSITLPPKKRGHGEKAGISEADIKKATAEALAAKPIVIGIERIKKKLTQSEEERAASKPSWLVDEEDIDDDHMEAGNEKTEITSNNDVPESHGGADDETLNTPNPGSNPDDEDMDDDVLGRNGESNPLEGSVTEDDPPENMFGDDDDEEIAEPPPSKPDDVVGESVPQGNIEASVPSEGNQDEDEHAQEYQSQDEQVADHHQLHHQIEESGLDDDPFTSNAGTTNDDDLLTSAADASSMEEAGDEQYKNLIAEPHMDDIFN